MKIHRWLLASSLILVGTRSLVACSSDPTNPVTPTDSGPDVTTGNDAETGPQPDADNDGAADANPSLRFGRVDRAGRVATIALLVSTANDDQYNFTDTFTFAGGLDGGVIRSEFQRSLVKMDLLDGVDDWDGGSPEGSTALVDAGPDADAAVVPSYPHPLVAPLSSDVLLVDTAKPFCPDGYLGIEFQLLTTAATFATQTSCGGRWLADDAVDKTLSVMTKRSLTGVSDNVAAATKAPTLTFPYVAPPN